MSDPIVYLNGEWLPRSTARISPLDRGFLFADGIYEVIPVYNGKPFGLQPHLDRLHRSLTALKIVVHTDWPQLFQQLVDHNGGGHLSIYLQITRGAPAKREHKIDPTTTPTVFAMANPIRHNLAIWHQGISLNTVTDQRWNRCDIKSVALLANILGLMDANQAGADDALLVREGELLETSAGNLCLVQDGVLMTPPCTTHILPGITRLLTLHIARTAGVPVEERPLPVGMLATASELWMLSSTKELVPVVTVNGQPIGDGQPGPVWRRLFALYQAQKVAECGAGAEIVL